MPNDDETLTLPEVAKLAGMQSDTLRMWYRRGYLGDHGGKGWKRYTLRDAAQIMVYASVVRSTKDHEIATHAVEAFLGHMAAKADEVEGEGVWLVCYRTENPTSGANRTAKAMREAQNGPPELPEVYLECHKIDEEREALKFIQELLSGQASLDRRPVSPVIVPIHTLTGAVSEELIRYAESRKKGDGK